MNNNMSWLHVSYFISMIITTALMAVISWYSRKHRKIVPGASVYMWLSLLLCLLGIFDILQMLSPSAEIALIFFNLRFISFAFMPVLWIIFVFHFSGKPDIISKQIIGLLCIIPVITQIMIWTNGLHGLWIIHNVGFLRSGFFLFADTSVRIPGVWQKIHNLYTYLLLLAGIVLLFYISVRIFRRQRGQALFLGFGTLIMIAGSLFPAFNLVPGMKINPMPQSFGLGSIIIAWGMYRHRFLVESPVMDKEKKIPVVLIVLFVVMTSGIITAGYINYRLYSAHHQAETERQLLAISELKVDDLIQWRIDRISDGSLLFHNTAFNSLVKKFLSESGDANTESQIKTWFNKIKTSYRYNQIYLIDNSGRQRLSIPQKSDTADGDCLHYLDEVRRSGEVVLTDFHRSGSGKQVHLSVIVPIVEEYGYKSHIGFVVMIIDPDVYLYPFLKRWPVPSVSAETLIVRRDGNDVLFLNDLRFFKNAALNLRQSLENKQLPAVMAALGNDGYFEGFDYRGVHVAAALRTVPDSPWYMVAKVDINELYGPVKERFTIMVIVILGLIGAAGTGIAYIWRKQSENFYREKYEAAEELRESEGKLKTAYDRFNTVFFSNVVGIVIADFNGGLIEVNDYYLKMIGYTREDFESGIIRWDMITPPEHKSSDLKALEELRESGICIPYEKEYLRKDGSRVWVLLADLLIPGPEHHIFAFAIDVTDRKLTEQHLQTQYTLLTALVNSPKDIIIFSLDKNYCYTAFNIKHFEEMKKVWGVEIETGTNLLECMNVPELKELAKLSIDRALSGEVFTEIQHQPDVNIYYEFSWNPIFLNGTVIGITVFIRNITERKIMEDMLQTSRDELQKLISSMTAAFVLFESVFDNDGLFISYRFVYINESYERITGVKNDEVKGRTVHDVWPDTEPEWVKRYGEVAVTGVSQTFDLYHENTGKHYHCNVYRPGETSNRFCVVFEDITDQKKIEDERKFFMEEVERSNFELQQFAYVASHDLQEPLRMISSFLQLIEQRYKDKLDDDANDFIHFAVDGANRLQSLIIGLLEYSRVRTHGKPFAEVDVKKVLGTVLLDLAMQINESGAEVKYGEMPVINADEIQISRLFQNLIQNSIKYRREGINPIIKISAEKNKTEYIFCISDNGIGIEKQYFDRIFTIFQRLHSRDEYPGTGIGLSVCKRIVERHGGLIWVESQYGDGASFYFTIPGGLQ